MNNNIKKYIVVIGIIIIIAIILLIRGCDSETPTIELLGDDTIVINQNEQFIDPGYDIVGTKNINNYYIDIDGYVNTNNMGKYLLKYYLYNKNGKLVYEKTREVIVLNKGISNITMVLKGDEEEYYFPGDYTDNGVEVYEGEKDISNQVIIDSNVNPNEVGEYIVKYQIVNGNDHKELIRKVNVINYDIERKIDEKNYMISLIIKCGGYSHTILPDGIATYSEQVVYFYTTVGQYNFDIYLKSGSHKKYSVKINEIKKDNEAIDGNNKPPISVSDIEITGSCLLNPSSNSTTVTVNVNKPSEVEKYVVSGKAYRTSPFTVSGSISQMTIIAFNKANKPYPIKCERKTPAYSYGFKEVNYSKLGWYPCGNDVSEANRDLENIIKTYGSGTRAAVASAATYLANYKYNIQYYWAGKYNEKGLNPRWGCTVNYFQQQVCSVKIGTTQCQMGLDCTGFTKWAYINGGFPANIIPRSSQERSNWGNFNASKHLFAFGDLQAAAFIQPGDLVAVLDSHVGIVIGVDSTRVQIAHESGGIKITTVLKSSGKSTDGNGDFTHFVLMDEFYKTYGKA